MGGERQAADSQAHLHWVLCMKPTRLCGNQSCSRPTCKGTGLQTHLFCCLSIEPDQKINDLLNTATIVVIMKKKKKKKWSRTEERKNLILWLWKPVSLNICFLMDWPRSIFALVYCDVPALWGKEHPRFLDACGQKEWLKSEGLQRLQVLLVNYTLGIEIGMLVPDLLYKHMAAGFG